MGSSSPSSPLLQEPSRLVNQDFTSFRPSRGPLTSGIGASGRALVRPAGSGGAGSLRAEAYLPPSHPWLSAHVCLTSGIGSEIGSGIAFSASHRSSSPIPLFSNGARGRYRTRALHSSGSLLYSGARLRGSELRRSRCSPQLSGGRGRGAAYGAPRASLSSSGSSYEVSDPSSRIRQVSASSAANSANTALSSRKEAEENLKAEKAEEKAGDEERAEEGGNANEEEKAGEGVEAGTGVQAGQEERAGDGGSAAGGPGEVPKFASPKEEVRWRVGALLAEKERQGGTQKRTFAINGGGFFENGKWTSQVPLSGNQSPNKASSLGSKPMSDKGALANQDSALLASPATNGVASRQEISGPSANLLTNGVAVGQGTNSKSASSGANGVVLGKQGSFVASSAAAKVVPKEQQKASPPRPPSSFTANDSSSLEEQQKKEEAAKLLVMMILGQENPLELLRKEKEKSSGAGKALSASVLRNGAAARSTEAAEPMMLPRSMEEDQEAESGADDASRDMWKLDENEKVKEDIDVTKRGGSGGKARPAQQMQEKVAEEAGVAEEQTGASSSEARSVGMDKSSEEVEQTSQADFLATPDKTYVNSGSSAAATVAETELASSIPADTVSSDDGTRAGRSGRANVQDSPGSTGRGRQIGSGPRMSNGRPNLRSRTSRSRPPVARGNSRSQLLRAEEEMEDVEGMERGKQGGKMEEGAVLEGDRQLVQQQRGEEERLQREDESQKQEESQETAQARRMESAEQQELPKLPIQSALHPQQENRSRDEPERLHVSEAEEAGNQGEDPRKSDFASSSSSSARSRKTVGAPQERRMSQGQGQGPLSRRGASRGRVSRGGVSGVGRRAPLQSSRAGKLAEDEQEDWEGKNAQAGAVAKPIAANNFLTSGDEKVREGRAGPVQGLGDSGQTEMDEFPDEWVQQQDEESSHGFPESPQTNLLDEEEEQKRVGATMPGQPIRLEEFQQQQQQDKEAEEEIKQEVSGDSSSRRTRTSGREIAAARRGSRGGRGRTAGNRGLSARSRDSRVQLPSLPMGLAFGTPEGLAERDEQSKEDIGEVAAQQASKAPAAIDSTEGDEQGEKESQGETGDVDNVGGSVTGVRGRQTDDHESHEAGPEQQTPQDNLVEEGQLDREEVAAEEEMSSSSSSRIRGGSRDPLSARRGRRGGPGRRVLSRQADSRSRPGRTVPYVSGEAGLLLERLSARDGAEEEVEETEGALETQGLNKSTGVQERKGGSNKEPGGKQVFARLQQPRLEKSMKEFPGQKKEEFQSVDMQQWEEMEKRASQLSEEPPAQPSQKQQQQQEEEEKVPQPQPLTLGSSSEVQSSDIEAQETGKPSAMSVLLSRLQKVQSGLFGVDRLLKKRKETRSSALSTGVGAGLGGGLLSLLPFQRGPSTDESPSLTDAPEESGENTAAGAKVDTDDTREGIASATRGGAVPSSDDLLDVPGDSPVEPPAVLDETEVADVATRTRSSSDSFSAPEEEEAPSSPTSVSSAKDWFDSPNSMPGGASGKEEEEAAQKQPEVSTGRAAAIAAFTKLLNEKGSKAESEVDGPFGGGGGSFTGLTKDSSFSESSSVQTGPTFRIERESVKVPSSALETLRILQSEEEAETSDSGAAKPASPGDLHDDSVVGARTTLTDGEDKSLEVDMDSVADEESLFLAPAIAYASLADAAARKETDSSKQTGPQVQEKVSESPEMDAEDAHQGLATVVPENAEVGKGLNGSVAAAPNGAATLATTSPDVSSRILDENVTGGAVLKPVGEAVTDEAVVSSAVSFLAEAEGVLAAVSASGSTDLEPLDTKVLPQLESLLANINSLEISYTASPSDFTSTSSNDPHLREVEEAVSEDSSPSLPESKSPFLKLTDSPSLETTPGLAPATSGSNTSASLSPIVPQQQSQSPVTMKEFLFPRLRLRRPVTQPLLVAAAQADIIPMEPSVLPLNSEQKSSATSWERVQTALSDLEKSLNNDASSNVTGKVNAVGKKGVDLESLSVLAVHSPVIKSEAATAVIVDSSAASEATALASTSTKSSELDGSSLPALFFAEQPESGLLAGAAKSGKETNSSEVVPFQQSEPAVAEGNGASSAAISPISPSQSPSKPLPPSSSLSPSPSPVVGQPSGMSGMPSSSGGRGVRSRISNNTGRRSIGSSTHTSIGNNMTFAAGLERSKESVMADRDWVGVRAVGRGVPNGTASTSPGMTHKKNGSSSSKTRSTSASKSVPPTLRRPLSPTSSPPTPPATSATAPPAALSAANAAAAAVASLTTLATQTLAVDAASPPVIAGTAVLAAAAAAAAITTIAVKSSEKSSPSSATPPSASPNDSKPPSTAVASVKTSSAPPPPFAVASTPITTAPPSADIASTEGSTTPPAVAEPSGRGTATIDGDVQVAEGQQVKSWWVTSLPKKGDQSDDVEDQTEWVVYKEGEDSPAAAPLETAEPQCTEEVVLPAVTSDAPAGVGKDERQDSADVPAGEDEVARESQSDVEDSQKAAELREREEAQGAKKAVQEAVYQVALENGYAETNGVAAKKAEEAPRGRISAARLTEAIASAEAEIVLYYATGWERAYLHYCADDKSWTEVPGMLMMTSQTDFGEMKVSRVAGERLEFVLTDGEGQWDKTAQGENYMIGGAGFYILADGVIREWASDSQASAPDRVTVG